MLRPRYAVAVLLAINGASACSRNSPDRVSPTAWQESHLTSQYMAVTDGPPIEFTFIPDDLSGEHGRWQQTISGVLPGLEEIPPPPGVTGPGYGVLGRRNGTYQLKDGAFVLHVTEGWMKVGGKLDHVSPGDAYTVTLEDETYVVQVLDDDGIVQPSEFALEPGPRISGSP